MSSSNTTIPDIVSVNGRLGGGVSVTDRGLAFGDGVFETLRVRHSAIPLWPYHRDRLLAGCQRLAIDVDVHQVEHWVDELLKHHDATVDGVVKIIVTRGAGGRGYAIDKSLIPTIVCSLHPGAPQAGPSMSLYLCQQRLSRNPLLAGIKHLNRLENVLLKAECQNAGFEDGLVLDDQFVIEAVSSNVFFERDDELFTPALTRCGVEGVMRRFILEELAPELGVKVNVKDITVDELNGFSAMFCSNSVRGIVPVASLKGPSFDRSNPEDYEVKFSEGYWLKQLLNSLQSSRFCA
ncbi:aminodeoxychorismate lyase [Pseudomaricurvus sp.]|uniref:aminodeoxychorismate lyase n=1 Tax=Pseudomaricurvus sp. TaxID=2004510 RepID=UPI003F6D84A9